MADKDFLRRLDPSDPRLAFDCADDDLNEFFCKDSIACGKQLLAVTYAIEKQDKTIAFFCVSNDSIKKEDLTRSRFKRIVGAIPREKRYSSVPAVKIGRLGVDVCAQGSGIGTTILDFVKVWFTIKNKTGCRFILVDAYNKEKVTSFYQKNDFKFLTEGDATDSTRLMYFDLITFQEGGA